MTHDIGPVSGRSQLRNQQILKLRSWIAPAQQQSLVSEVDPIDGFHGGERVVFRNCDHDPLAPKRHRIRLGQRRGAGDDRDVDGGIAKRSDETRSRTLEHLDFDLREALPNPHQRCTKIPSRQ
jgi:hypothetical protein